MKDDVPDPASSLPERLTRGPFGGSWSVMVGAWPTYVRVLHPFFRETPNGMEPRRWSQLPGWDLVANPGQVGWETLTGVRLHKGTTGSGWDLEPTVGPDGVILPALLRTLIGPETGQLWVGQWRGYPDPDPSGSQVLRLWGRAREYAVIPIEVDELFRRTSAAPPPVGDAIVPDLVWDADRHFLALADIDLPCTVVGCVEPVARRLLSAPGLEAYVAAASDPVVL